MPHPGIPTLTTPRLVLRPFVRSDLVALIALHAEESFWWYPLRGAMPPEETAEFLNRMLERYESDGFGIEAVVERESGVMIGWAGLAVPHFLPEILPAVEVGWRLSGPWRGRGLATEAGAAAVAFGFTDGGLERIVSIYEPDNLASGRVMERLGFSPWLRTTGPRGEEVVVMELDRADWEEVAGG
jgi:RimJ/RimL family protein N-acetyltransferase